MSGRRASIQNPDSSVLKYDAALTATKNAAIKTRVDTGSDMRGATSYRDDAPLFDHRARMFQEIQPSPRDVLADLVGELQCRAELLLATEQAVEVEPHGIAVDI